MVGDTTGVTTPRAHAVLGNPFVAWEVAGKGLEQVGKVFDVFAVSVVDVSGGSSVLALRPF
jgi:hypothetical protein